MCSHVFTWGAKYNFNFIIIISKTLFNFCSLKYFWSPRITSKKHLETPRVGWINKILVYSNLHLSKRFFVQICYSYSVYIGHCIFFVLFVLLRFVNNSGKIHQMPIWQNKFNSLTFPLQNRFNVKRGNYNYLDENHVHFFENFLGANRVVIDLVDLEKYNVDWFLTMRGMKALYYHNYFYDK